MNDAAPAIDVVDEAEPLVSYAYSYPHKSSYRRFEPPIPIADVWQDDDQQALGLYVHIPYCEMRCGFCNLFTQSQPDEDALSAYLATLFRQMRIVRGELPRARFAMFAMGGGTPTYLSPRDLSRLLTTISDTYPIVLSAIPTSVETSPATATRERLSILADHGIERISLGVQSFLESDTRLFGRPQQRSQVTVALETIRSLNFPILNIDLIYGSVEQTCESWLQSLRSALAFQPEELFLYPLYVRPETGLARTRHQAAEHRLDLYRAGRDLLREKGYDQISMRCFRKQTCSVRNTTFTCTRDGTVGLGCGARSYTQSLHYATRFAVTQAGIRVILRDWIAQSDQELSLATHGIRLSDEEQRRRLVILSLLQADGFDLRAYFTRFGTHARSDIPQLRQLLARDWVHEDAEQLTLTDAGRENSDVIGPLLYSDSVRNRLREFIRL